MQVIQKAQPAEIELIKSLDSRALAVLSVKMVNSDLSLREITDSLYPDLAPATRKLIYTGIGFGKLLEMMKENPALSAQLLSAKLLPLSVLSLHKIMVGEGVRDNVRVTAAKELIKFGSESMRYLSGPVAYEPKDNLTKLLEGNMVNEEN